MCTSVCDCQHQLQPATSYYNVKLSPANGLSRLVSERKVKDVDEEEEEQEEE